MPFMILHSYPILNAMNFSQILPQDTTLNAVNKLNSWASKLNQSVFTFRSEPIDLNSEGIHYLNLVSETGQKLLPHGRFYLIVQSDEAFAQNPIISMGSAEGNFEDYISPIELEWPERKVIPLPMPELPFLLSTEGEGLALVVLQATGLGGACTGILVGEAIWVD